MKGPGEMDSCSVSRGAAPSDLTSAIIKEPAVLCFSYFYFFHKMEELIFFVTNIVIFRFKFGLTF